MWWMLLASALASPVEVQVGPVLHANDPFTSRAAIEGLVALRTQRVFALELGGAGTVPAFVPYPGVTEPLAYGLIVHNRVAPTLSRPLGHAWVSTSFAVLDGALGNGRSSRHLAVDLVFTLGLVWTQEDMEALQADTDPNHPAWLTHRQTHVFHGFGPRARVQIARGTELVLSSTVRRYAETVSGEDVDIERAHWMGAGLRWTLQG